MTDNELIQLMKQHQYSDRSITRMLLWKNKND